MTAPEDAARQLERYRAMIEEASDIIVLNENGRTVCASAAFERLLGRKPEEFQNGGYLDFVHPDDVGEAQKLLGRPPPGAIWTATYRVRHADGQYIWFEVTTRGVYDEAGGFSQEIAVGRDITERKEQELAMRAAREHAEAANKAKSLFLATVSHELRTPLNAILGFSELLKGASSAKTDYIEAIHNSGKHLLGLINDVLDISKLDQGKLEIRTEAVALPQTIEECVASILPLAAKHGIRIHADLDPAAASLDADPKRLRQMLLNLLSNGVKFTPEGGEVRVSTLRRDGDLAITVIDTGIGIEVDAIPQVLKPFGQIDNSLSRKYEGTGLGLPLTKQLAELHGATLTIESKVGGGTSVTILFPAASALPNRHVA